MAYENPSGIKFPFRFANSGGVRIARGSDKVGSNLEALSCTAILERLIRKTVGTIGYRTVLRNSDEASRRAVKDLLREAITKHERRARLLTLNISTVNTDKGTATYIDGAYIFRQTGEKSTFRTQIA